MLLRHGMIYELRFFTCPTDVPPGPARPFSTSNWASSSLGTLLHNSASVVAVRTSEACHCACTKGHGARPGRQFEHLRPLSGPQGCHLRSLLIPPAMVFAFPEQSAVPCL